MEHKGFNIGEYYTYEELQSDDILGKTVSSQFIVRYIQPIKIDKINYYPKERVQYYINVRKECVYASEIENMVETECKLNLPYLVKKLKAQGKQVDILDNHPFARRGLLFKGYEEILEHLKFNKDDYYTYKQVRQQDILGIRSKRLLDRYIKPIMYSACSYYAKADIDYYSKMKKETVESTKLAETLNMHTSSDIRRLVLYLGNQDNKIEWITNHPLGSCALVRGYEAVISYVQNSIICSQNYYTFKEIKSFNGFENIVRATLNKHVNMKRSGDISYYDKKDIEYYRKMKQESMDASQLKALLGIDIKTFSMKTFVDQIREQGINVEFIPRGEHIFGPISLIRGYNNLIEFAKTNKPLAERIYKARANDETAQMNAKEKALFKIKTLYDCSHAAYDTLNKFCLFVEKRYDTLVGFDPFRFIKLSKYMVKHLDEDLIGLDDVNIDKLRADLSKLPPPYTAELNFFVSSLFIPGYKFRNETQRRFGVIIDKEYGSGYVSFDFLSNVCRDYIYKDCKSYRDIERKLRAIINHLKTINIKYYLTKNNIYVEQSDGIKFLNFYKYFDHNAYYTTKDIVSKDVLGISNAVLLNKFIEPVRINRFCYYPKDKVAYFEKIRKECMEATKIADIIGVETIVPVKTIVRILKEKGFEVDIIPPSQHPFHNGLLVKGFELVIEYGKKDKKISEMTDIYEKFRFQIDNLNVNNKKAPKTLKDFLEFVEERYDDGDYSDGKLVPAHIRIYKCLAGLLNKEFIYLTSGEIEDFIKFNQNNGGCSLDEIEINNFIKYLNCNYRDSLLPDTKYEKPKRREVIAESVSYTEKQWFAFMKLVFESIDQPEYIELALKNRGCAMTWLYFALHFVTGIRAINMQKLPKPNLDIIGFKSGSELLEFVKNNGVFTKQMGDAICEDIRLKIMSYGSSSKKTSQKLTLIIGDSMVRQVGFLFALAEAHRQTVKGKHANKATIITSYSKTRTAHTRLFGHKYNEIFKDDTFGNLKATNTHLKIEQEKGDMLDLFRASVLRGHNVDFGEISSTTADIYVTHGYNNEDKDIDKIAFNILDRPVFSFAPYLILGTLVNGFNKLEYSEQTKRINQLGLAPYQIEGLSKGIVKQVSEVNVLINTMLKEDKQIIIECMKTLSEGKAPAKHQFTDCLLKAMLKSGMNNTIDSLSQYSIKNKCVYSDWTTCFACEFLIGQKLFLYELGDRLWEVVSEAKNCTTRRDRQRNRNNIMKLRYILYQAIVTLGIDIVKHYINIGDLRKAINELTLLD